MSVQKVKTYFDSVSSHYEYDSQKYPWNFLRSYELYHFKKNLEIDQLKGEILEIGCGSGFYTNVIFSQQDQSYTCLDISQKMLDQINLDVKKINGTINDLPEYKKYDYVFALGVI